MKPITLLGLCLAGSVFVSACGKKDDGAPAVLAVPAAPAVPAAVPAPPAPAVAPVEAAASVAVAAPLIAPPASIDPDNPTALPGKQIKGVGIKQKVSMYYTFDAGVGKITLTANGKNEPSGFTQALGFGLYDLKANQLCFDALGNTTVDKTVTVNCLIEKAGPLILRLDIDEETIDYALTLDGPVTLTQPKAVAGAQKTAGPGSTDIDEPTRLTVSRIKGEGIKKAVSYYYAFNAGPGELTLTIDGKNEATGVADALGAVVYTLRSERLCEGSLGNTTLDKRVVVACNLDKRQPVILRLNLAAETIDFRARFDGPYDFEEFVAPKVVTIALDSEVLFDSGKSELKPAAQQTLREAAERIKKFAGASVMISGHTDNVGNDAANKALSDKRAAAVRDYVVSKEGVKPDGLAVKGFGKSQPVADNGSEAGRARNRRVEVTITPKS